ncbi:MAG: GMC family oxidoreductase N-terminal domain-containing protein [Alphaproteobacteria bacterium]|nr:GMC family oxidoreductase N-terminal domain-containing protein [Alphaproteobacteria bacterium]
MAGFGERVFDYVIVGGGSAGSVLASRLSERPGNDVLLLEAGEDFPPGEEPPEILDSFAGTAHSNPRFTWPNLTAAFLPRPGNAPDTRPRRRYTQGRVIGGGSSVNGMVSVRGLPSDYDDWAARGAAGWDWEGVLPFFKKLEHDRDFDGPLHGKDGPIGLRRIPADVWPGFVTAVIGAVKDAGFEDIKDQNADFRDGYFPIAICNIDDTRVSAAIGYLTAEVRARNNLTIVGESPVDRLVFDGTRVVGVAARNAAGGFEVRAREVIVSAGALHSPALLLRSGIGRASELAALGIATVADRPGVGKHLMEHPGVNFGCYMKPDARLPATLRRQMFAGLRWSSGLDGCPAGDMYLIPTNKTAWHDIGARLGVIMVWVNRSYSTGEVRLTSADPGAPIDVDFDMCSDPRDLERLVMATRMMIELQKHPAIRGAVEEIFPISYSDRARKLAVYSRFNEFQTWLGGQAMDASGALRRFLIRSLIADGPTVDDLANDESAMIAWIRDTVLGHWHASCTCRMGAADDPLAVTDPTGRVYGVEGLRVCDASIMPMVPCANTNIPTIMVGEKIAASILAQ